MTLTRENHSNRRKRWPTASTSTTNLTWTDLESKADLRGENSATVRLSDGAAFEG